MNAKEIKLQTGARTRLEGIALLYEKLSQKQWFRAGREFSLAGFDYRKNLVNFTCTWGLEGGGAGHSRVGLSLEESLRSDGDLAGAQSLL